MIGNILPLSWLGLASPRLGFDTSRVTATIIDGFERLVRAETKRETAMKGEFTAIIEPAPEGGFWAVCLEVPGANGQGETVEEAKRSLREAIELLLEDRRADLLRGLPDDAIQDTVMVG